MEFQHELVLIDDKGHTHILRCTPDSQSVGFLISRLNTMAFLGMIDYKTLHIALEDIGEPKFHPSNFTTGEPKDV